ncbi:MAG TPA: cation transporter [Thiotrichales bacterium]|nr:cation transporter [Thiotrichales bacterium]
METTQGQLSNGERHAETRRVTLIGAVLNLVLAAMKILFGWLTQSQALIADGVHSLSDLLSDGLVWFASSHAAQDPDQEHPYGHGRFETLATLGLGVLLGLVGLGIGWDAVSRLFDPGALVVPGGLALVIALLSILTKEWLYHYTLRVARRIKSEMVRANAWHHRSDAVSSIVVLVGVGGAMAGLPYLDALAAAVVALMIAHVGWEIGWPAAQELADSGLEEARLQQIRSAILSVRGVKAIHMLRTRKMGGRASVDVHVLVDPWLSVSEGHIISQTVTDRLREQVEEVDDVTVHIDPEDDEEAPPTAGLPLREEAERLLAAHWEGIEGAEQRERLVFHYLDGRVDVDVYFPLSLCTGNGTAQALREALQARLAPLPEFGRVRIYFG